MKFHCYSSDQIDNRGLRIKLVNFTLLSLALFGYIDTFPGWVGRAKLRLKSISAQLKLKLGLGLAIKVVALYD